MLVIHGFGILADTLNELPPALGFGAVNPIREHCFVPAVSAISLRESATHDDLYTPISEEDLEETPFHAVKLASQSDTHPDHRGTLHLVPGPAAIRPCPMW
ncbi:hypothetical protein [Streptomyces sp. NPDC056323]|uniref:hypothetical protein n=1 Tax=unclassified Streptomyces TaxID=2593676 RepID=UPI0035D608DA